MNSGPEWWCSRLKGDVREMEEAGGTSGRDRGCPQAPSCWLTNVTATMLLHPAAIVDFRMSTKIRSPNLKVESSFIWWDCLGLSPGDSISVALRKSLQGGSGEVRLATSLQQREKVV